jgi:P63C domain
MSMAPYVGQALREKLENPLIFQSPSAGGNSPPPTKVNGYDVSILIDICRAVVAAEESGAPINPAVVRQAHTIVGASAKVGIKHLVYALAGYNPTAEEVIAAFKLYVQEEARKYEPEFPNELYIEWHRLYNIPVPERGKPWHFKYLTVNHIYTPIANSNGKILELIRIMKTKDGDRQKKLFQFLNQIGARALRIQLGRVLEMAESSKNQAEYEAKIVARFGGQRSFEFTIVPKPSNALPPPSEQSPIDAPAS